MSTFRVGDEVEVVRPVIERPDEGQPGGVLARPGERLIVRVVHPHVVMGDTMSISVSHHDRTDGMMFRVRPSEIRPIA